MSARRTQVKKEVELNPYLIRLLSIAQGLDSVNLFPEVSKLTKTEFRILREIVVEERQGNRIISSELARRVGVTRSAISQIVTKLEERDVLQRTDAPDDRKIAYVNLSQKAHDIFNKECELVNANMEKVVEEFGTEKMENWLDACDELLATVARLKAQKESTSITEPKTES